MPRKTIEWFGKMVDNSVNFYAYGIAVLLVIYMLSSLVIGGWEFLHIIYETFSNPALMDKGIQTLLDGHILHFVAFSVVLIKAYRILMFYAATQHVNIKYIVEIAIIASTIEIVFKTHSYPMEILVLFAVFGFANLVIFVLKFQQFEEIGEDKDVISPVE